ncbi:MAG: ferrous iron transport protein A [Hydrogenibacillus sp.]|nr:ferrous iron transport protein A [Hydrogenibacillus sp.]
MIRRSWRHRKRALDAASPRSSLAHVPAGGTAVIRDLSSAPGWLRERLFAIGLFPGVRIRVERRMPLGGPIVVSFDGQMFALRPKDGRPIGVEVEP